MPLSGFLGWAFGQTNSISWKFFVKERACNAEVWEFFKRTSGIVLRQQKLTLQIEVNWPNFVITVTLTNARRPVCSIVTSLELDCALPATVQRSWIRPYQRRRSRRLQTINPESSQPENGIPIRAPLSEIPALLRKRPVVVVVVVLVVLVSFFCAVATAAGWVWFMTLHHSSFSGTCRSCVHSVCDNVKGYSRLCIVSRVLAQVWFCPGKPPKGTSFTSWSE